MAVSAIETEPAAIIEARSALEVATGGVEAGLASCALAQCFITIGELDQADRYARQAVGLHHDALHQSRQRLTVRGCRAERLAYARSLHLLGELEMIRASEPHVDLLGSDHPFADDDYRTPSQVDIAYQIYCQARAMRLSAHPLARWRDDRYAVLTGLRKLRHGGR